ncbi:MAG: aminodeoxychorismate synthase component I [Burkholderiales bacterium]
MNAPLLTGLPYREDSAPLFEAIADLPWSAYLDSGPPRGGQGRYDIIAAQPYATLVTRGAMTEIQDAGAGEISPDDPFDLIRQHLSPIARASSELPFAGGAIGYLSYDLGRRLERLPVAAEDAEKIPEMVIGIYDWAVVVDHDTKRAWLAGQGRDPRTRHSWSELVARFSSPVQARFRQPFRVTSKVTSNMSREQYAAAFDRVKNYIQEGDCYQVNLAQRFSARAEGDAWLAYQNLRLLNPAPFSAYLNTPYCQILSSSPERFLSVKQRLVETKPIKGTRPRSNYPRLDSAFAEELCDSEKDHAENVMIVDLLRNDLGKTCELGSVAVPKLFDIESYATVHHLVTTVTGRLASQYDALHLLRGCFPGGSVTGAPKLRSMQIIEELEPHRRGVYCGSIGYIGFDGDMDTNIAIRTLVYSGAAIRCWAGGGIVADSRMSAEYQETFDKAAAMLRLLQQEQAADVGR